MTEETQKKPRSSNGIECYVRNIPLTKGEDGKDREWEQVYFDIHTFLPVSPFKPNKVGNVSLYIACIALGEMLERTQGKFGMPIKEEYHQKIATVMRAELTKLLGAYLKENHPYYFHNREASWRKTIEIAIKHTIPNGSYYWRSREKAIFYPANDN